MKLLTIVGARFIAPSVPQGHRNNEPQGHRSNVPRATRPLLILFLLLLSSLLSAESPVSISILSILKPTELRMTVRQPDRAMIQTDSSVTAVTANSPIHIKLQEKRLLLNSNVSTESVNIECPDYCIVELMMPGLAPRKYQGNLRLTSAGSTINIVLQTEQDSLLTSIVASEMGEYSEREALRAFTIVARSFLVARSRHPELGADFCDLTHCQVFQSYAPSVEARLAARDTAGLILKYRNRSFRPYYSRSCGGKTATFEEVWGEKSPDYPFASVPCGCNTPWRTTLKAAQLRKLVGAPVQLAIQQQNAITMNHKFSFRLEQFRVAVGRMLGWDRVLSNSFMSRQQGEDLVIEGNGIGHRVGFCQNGAYQMSKQKRTYQEILQHYFPNTEIRTANSESI